MRSIVVRLTAAILTLSAGILLSDLRQSLVECNPVDEQILNPPSPESLLTDEGPGDGKLFPMHSLGFTGIGMYSEPEAHAALQSELLQASKIYRRAKLRNANDEVVGEMAIAQFASASSPGRILMFWTDGSELKYEKISSEQDIREFEKQLKWQTKLPVLAVVEAR